MRIGRRLLLCFGVLLVVVGGTPAVADAATPPNPGFEQDCGGIPCNWTKSSGFVTRNASVALAGSASIQIGPGGSPSSSLGSATSDCFAISPGTYDASVSYYAVNNTTSVRLAYAFYSSADCSSGYLDGTLLSTDTPTLNSWTLLSGKVTAPPGTVAAVVVLSAVGNVNLSGGWAFFDELTQAGGPPPPPPPPSAGIGDPTGDALFGADIVGVGTAVAGSNLTFTISLAAPLAADAGADVVFDTKAGGLPSGGFYPGGMDYSVALGVPLDPRRCGLWRYDPVRGGAERIGDAECQYSGGNVLTLVVPAAQVEAGSSLRFAARTIHFESSPVRRLFQDDIAPNGECGAYAEWNVTTNVVSYCAPPPPPVVDQCGNIVGVQATVPAGMVKDQYDNCVTPSAPPVVPPAIPGPQAAPPRTIVEQFADAGQATTATVPVAPTARTVQIALTWRDPTSSFDVKRIQLVRGGRALAGSVKLKPRKLKITKTRRRQSVDVRVRNVTKGKLKFTTVAKSLQNPTKVTVKIRESRR